MTNLFAFSAAIGYGHLARTTRGVIVQITLEASATETISIEARVDSGSS